MKKSILFTGAALLAFCSCTNEINEEGFVDKVNSISFNAYANKTRTIDEDVTSSNMKEDNFGVVGYNGNSLYLGATDKAVKQIWKADENVTGGGSWEYENPSELKFWPTTGQMQFFAFFPFTDNATFSDDINGTETAQNPNVMTIPNLTCKYDVLFAATNSMSYQERVPLNFHHAFSKIKAVNIEIRGGNVESKGINVEVQKVEFINTATHGSVLVAKDGTASYGFASTPLSVDFSSSTVSTVTVSSTNKTGTLIKNYTETTSGEQKITKEEANGYLFATNSASSDTNPVKGTGKTFWNGVKSSIGENGKLSTSDLVCLKLTCKVWDNDNHYYVGSATEGGYGEMYIPLTGTDSNPNNVASFIAGKRYIYNIVWEHNVGFDDNGDPILNPILFSVNSVDAWDDVEVTITL